MKMSRAQGSAMTVGSFHPTGGRNAQNLIGVAQSKLRTSTEVHKGWLETVRHEKSSMIK